MDPAIRIAFITPEAPPLSGGGIATFINNITKGLSDKGIFCEVFAPAFQQTSFSSIVNGVTFHYISTQNFSTFRTDVVPFFIERNQQVHFTVVESCEIHAALSELLQQKQTGIKYVIRLQMPEVYQIWLNDFYESRFLKLKYVLGSLRRGRWDLGFWNKVDVRRQLRLEYGVCENADQIIAPSNSFKKWLLHFWKQPSEKITVLYHLFKHSTIKPSASSSTSSSKTKPIQILFVGKLNAHKGVVNLAEAAKNLLARYNNIEFILIGEEWPIKYGLKKMPTGTLLSSIVEHHPAFKLLGKVNYNELANYYEAADICVFPSLWEAWGYTCTEAMSFGKAVIGSQYGGMADAIADGVDGLLVDPYSVKSIEQKIALLITNEPLRKTLGEAAKQKVNTALSFETLLKQNIDFYKKLLS